MIGAVHDKYLMEELKEQMRRDPAAFQRIMESLGLGTLDGPEGMAGKT